MADAAGNTGTATAANTYSSDVTPTPTNDKTALSIDPISGDNLISVSEGNASSLNVTGKVTGAISAGDVITLTLNPQTITTTAGAESKQLIIQVKNGQLTHNNLLVHFPIPMQQAWDNVTYTCSNMLLFEAEQDVINWCQRHKMPLGDIQPLQQRWAEINYQLEEDQREKAYVSLLAEADKVVAANAIEQAVSLVLDQGLRTGDILSAGTTKVGTAAMGDAVVSALRSL